MSQSKLRAAVPGYDLRASLQDSPLRIDPGEIFSIPTTVFVALDPGYALFVHSRSGLARLGVVVAHGVGVVDSDYRGEVRVLLRNLSEKPIFITNRERIAQAVIQKIETPTWVRVESLDETGRGDGGFGSTGRS
ncbi:MAG: dUTP diphosphatase [Deltaproteobacteria bacterium]|nr:dUTP diphosphatase [Deltaproteobacteria bacterium]